MNVNLATKHLLSIQDLSNLEICAILDRGDYWSQRLKLTALSSMDPDNNLRLNSGQYSGVNPIVCNLFFEPSTRTRFSFEVAAKKLGCHVLNFYPASSSTEKGETIYDTLKTLEAMGVNAAIIRTSEEDLLQEIAPKLSLALINAGAGSNEHPTQGLLDLLTIRQHFGYIEGLKVAIIGDIIHSRVAHSNIIALDKLNAEILLSGPEFLMPNDEYLSMFNKVRVCDVDRAVEQADIVMMLRVQKERHSQYCKELILSDYLENFGLTLAREKKMKFGAMIMHPAPFNRNIEIADELIEGPRSLIYKQVANGVSIRMAVLERAL